MAWKRVCSIEGFAANAIKKFAVDGVEVVAVNFGDDFRVIPPMCPHMEEPLDLSGICQDGVFTCTKHLWQWDLKTGAKRGDAQRDIKFYPSKIEGHDLLAFIDKPLEYEYVEEE